MKNEIFDNMLSRYDLTTEQQKRNAIFEVNQQVILAGLYAGGFFESAAFYGGTCLRIFHGLQRFSEDMDFSLLAQDDKFDFTKYFPAIVDAFTMVGREVEIKKKDKRNFGKVESAFLKDNTDVYETLLKGIQIMAKLPSIACYAYQSKMHYYEHKSLIIHYPRKDYSTAENILYMLRSDSNFSKQEANLLDIMLLLHADHGGGNNSTFTNVVISSTDTDIYSAVSGSIGSLKGPRHGGANIKVALMMDAVISEIGYTRDDAKIKDIVLKLLNKQFYNKSGLVYGFGHAVYTLSDPRAEILRHYCGIVAHEKGREEEFEFYLRFERIVKEILMETKGLTACANVDFYSGFAYDMLGIPRDMFTPLFVISRMVGWLAHNLENKLYDGRIMRPATKYVGELNEYVPMEDR